MIMTLNATEKDGQKTCSSIHLLVFVKLIIVIVQTLHGVLDKLRGLYPA
jgi:hypothetical protein